MSDGDVVPADQETPEPEAPGGEPDWFRRVTGIGSSLSQALIVPALALVTALIIGAVIIAVTDVDAWRAWTDESPGEALSMMWSSVTDGYRALFRGSLGSRNSISETLFSATPLIIAGLAVAVGFRAGLFNIGVNGQMHIGGLVAIYLGFTLSLPAVIHVPVVLIGAVIGGAVWGGIPGLLRAKTGAHEVITTIMLNFVALFLVDYMLKTSFYQERGRLDPISKQVDASARLPRIFGGDFRVHLGFLIALALVAFVYWLLFRSSIGFEFRAVGFNPDAARYAGMSVTAAFVGVMAVSGALGGIAGANQIIGLEPFRGTSNFAAVIGFDAIALALLGRSHPIGVLWAGLLFGGLRAGGRAMQGEAGIPIDLVLVVQALIIVLIAAPDLVRAIYRMKPAEPAPTQLTKGWGA
ncbi:MAG: ABC transporter permease [Acidimicrobiia bacterium]